MKRISLIIVTFFILIFFECDKKPTEPESLFDASLIPGIYTLGRFLYYNSTTNADGEIVQGERLNTDSIGSYWQSQVTVTKSGDGKYSLSSDYLLFPDLDVIITDVNYYHQLTPYSVGEWFCEKRCWSFIIIDNQTYTSVDSLKAGDFSQGVAQVGLSLYIKSNNPDDVHFLDISAFWDI
jgi:hypothetical protein